MSALPSYYTKLFNAITDTLEAIDQQNYGLAKNLLIEAQKTAVEEYLSDGE